jgi:hypothetical protein
VREGKYTESSCVLKIREYCWVKSRLDGKLYTPSDLFFDCDEVRSILGSNAPYATPQVKFLISFLVLLFHCSETIAVKFYSGNDKGKH